MDATPQSVASLAPVLQWGFAGVCLVLIGVIVWMISKFMEVLRDNNKVIASNTAAIISQQTTANETHKTVCQLKDLWLQRTCPLSSTHERPWLSPAAAPVG